MTVKNSWKPRRNKPLFCVFVIKGRILTYLKYLNDEQEFTEDPGVIWNDYYPKGNNPSCRLLTQTPKQPSRSAYTKGLRHVDSKLHPVVSTASYVLFSSRIMSLMADNVHFGATATDP